ncbi:MAG TPA: hypothetical protein VN851_24975 [Thermoanaerobaculia bacterium]|nr:hypothetical protein [Thermoanaerobaculia bacterium]
MKRNRKIRLHRETLARLDAVRGAGAARVIGGDTAFSECEVITECPSNCLVSCQPSCATGCATGTQAA